MASPFGTGVLQGLESGLRTGMALRRDERMEKRDERLFNLREKELAEATKSREESREQLRLDRALKAIETEREMFTQELGGVLKQYGGDINAVPTAIRQQYIQRGSELDRVRRGLAAKAYGPYLEEESTKARDLMSNLQMGKVNPDDVPDRDFTQAFQIAGQRPITDFMDQDGKPSVIRQGYSDFETGLKTQNNDLMMRGLNMLIGPDIRKGVGSSTPDGGKIVDKQLARLDPHPENPEMLVPSVMITVEYPDGSRKQGLAPVTAERTPDPDDDEIITIDMNKGMDYIHELYGLAVAANDPPIRKKFEKGLKDGADKDFDKFSQMLYGYGLDPKRLKGKMTIKDIDLTDRVLRHYFDEYGDVIKEESFEKGVKPGFRRSASMTELDEALDSGEITAEEYRQRRREKLLGNADKPKSITAEQQQKNSRILAARKQVEKIGKTLFEQAKQKIVEEQEKRDEEERLSPEKMKEEVLKEYNRLKGDDENKRFLKLIDLANEPLIGKDDPAFENYTGIKVAATQGAPRNIQGMQERGVGQEPQPVAPPQQAPARTPQSAAGQVVRVPEGLPAGTKFIGRSKGKPVFQSPDGKKYIVD